MFLIDQLVKRNYWLKGKIRSNSVLLISRLFDFDFNAFLSCSVTVGFNFRSTGCLNGKLNESLIWRAVREGLFLFRWIKKERYLGFRCFRCGSLMLKYWFLHSKHTQFLSCFLCPTQALMMLPCKCSWWLFLDYDIFYYPRGVPT